MADDTPGCRTVGPGDHLQKRRFSRPVSTQQRDGSPGRKDRVDVAGDMPDRTVQHKAFSQIFEDDHRRA